MRAWRMACPAKLVFSRRREDTENFRFERWERDVV